MPLKSKKKGQQSRKPTNDTEGKSVKLPGCDEFFARLTKHGNGNYILQCLKHNNSPSYHTSHFFNTRIEGTKRMTRKNPKKGIKGRVDEGDIVIAECDELTIKGLSYGDVLVVKFNHKYSDSDVRFLKNKMGLHDPLNKDKSTAVDDDIYFEGDTDHKKPTYTKKVVSDDYMAGIDMPPCESDSDYEDGGDADDTSDLFSSI